MGSKTLIEGVVKPKDEARAEYQEALSRQCVATLLEEHTPEVFETSLGNIPPRATVRVEIVYVNELKADLGGDGALVTILTSVAPRYGIPPEGFSRNNTTGSRLTVEERGMKIRVEVSASVRILQLECRTHPISVQLGSTHGQKPLATSQLALPIGDTIQPRPELLFVTGLRSLVETLFCSSWWRVQDCSLLALL